MRHGSAHATPTLPLTIILTLLVITPDNAPAADAIGVRVPDGFTATLYADDNLAHDIYSMTIDAQGRVVVSGAGYVRILLDEDGDGKAETFRQFADGPKTGAQGMYFLGRDLVCTGDSGLIRYRDKDGDDRADGPADVFLKVKTGAEHHVHSVQKGPDGWWYVIAGNYAGVTDQYVTLATSPVRKPEGGTLMRLKPDLSGGEILTHGFRNAYDFTFNQQGDVFVFDSDGERDVSLPWYRPTRVFHALPASHAGWFSRSWKRPDYFLDMPPVLAEFGRGSPTGMVCYQHNQFPEQYRGAVFALDWTFGRVLALPMARDHEVWQSKPIEFMTGVGQFGFAPTDVEIGPDGSLFVCVGGRGTRGGVFRITFDAAQKKNGSVVVKNLDGCLKVPQPLSSWSRERWTPVAKKLGKQTFLTAAINPLRPASERIRAIEILTELFGGPDDATFRQLAKDKSAEVRARAAWAVGRQNPATPNPELVLPFINDQDPLVARFALESLLGANKQAIYEPLLPALAKHLGGDRRFNRQTAARVTSRLTQSTYNQLTPLVQPTGAQGVLSQSLAAVFHKPGVDGNALETGLRILEAKVPIGLKREAVRLMQLSLGDVGPAEKRTAAFESYTARIDLSEHERQLDAVRIRLAKLYPTGDRTVDLEMSRLLAMLTPFNPTVLDSVLSRISADSHPVDDIHHLIVAACIQVDRNRQQQTAIAQGLIGLDSKIETHKLKQDSNWDTRVGEAYKRLVKLDPDLPAVLISQPEFGLPGHVPYLSEVTKEQLPPAVDAFVAKIKKDDEYPWSNGVVYVLGESQVPEHREMIRAQFTNFAARNAVLMVLAEKPDEADRSKYVAGLESSQLEVLAACLDALTKLPASQAAAEQLALLSTLRRLGSDRREFPLREAVVKLLRRNLALDFGFEFGEPGYQPQTEVIEKWTAAIQDKFPDESARQFGATNADLEQLKTQLASVNWEQGDPQRGRKLFERRSCAQCHGNRGALGPDLAGSARRFSRNDLFTAIAIPDRDVSPRYQTSLVQTVQGKIYTGLVVYQSVDGVTLRNSTNQTIRIEADDIELRRSLKTSLMPKGLLRDLKPEDLADLYAYIQELGKK